MFDSWRSASRSLDDPAARHLASHLVHAADAWSVMLLESVKREAPSLRSELATEVLAYAVCALEIRLTTSSPTPAAAFLGGLRRHCRALRQARDAALFRPLPPQSALETPEFTHRYLSVTTHARSGCPFREDIWKEFCETTGLGSSVLVGQGGNLAALIFYIVVHGRVMSDAPASREAMMRLLRAARDCAAFFEVALDQWFAGLRPETHALVNASPPKSLPQRSEASSNQGIWPR
jgi:hypothetical protein